MSKNKYFLIYQDNNSVRKLVEVPCDEQVSFIGLTHYREAPTFLPSSMTVEQGDVVLENSGSYPLLHQGIFNPLYGKMMQLCDAMIAEKEQREAFKGVVKDELGHWFDKNVGYTYKMTEQVLKAEQ